MEENSSILNKCVDLLKQYNKLGLAGQLKPTLVVSRVTYTSIHPKRHPIPDSSVARQLIQFYEVYTAQIIAASKLRQVLDTSLDDATNQLLFLKKEKKELEEFQEIRNRLVFHHQTLIDNLSTAVDDFVGSICVAVEKNPDDLDELIKVVYICMKQEGLSSVVAVEKSMRPFVYVGSRLIRRFSDLQLLNSEQINLVRLLNDDLRESLVGVRHELDRKSTFNHLQTFGIVPSEGVNKSLKEIMSHLLHIDISDEANLDVVSSLLKKISLDTGTATGMVVLVSPHPDLYIDLSTLSEQSRGRQSSNNGGVTEAQVLKFDIIKVGGPPSAQATQVRALNVDDQTEQAFVLWTNNFKTFKWREAPIDGLLLRKVMRLKPSQTIEQFNKLFESAIASSRTFDGISFNQTKYMSFTETVTESSFLDLLTSRVVSCVMKQCGSVEKSDLSRTITTDTFLTKLIQTFDDAKEDLGVPKDVLSAHCHIIYASIAIKASAKIRKELVLRCTSDDDTPITTQTVATLVKLVVQANDNIYSRVIASHYLHLA